MVNKIRKFITLPYLLIFLLLAGCGSGGGGGGSSEGGGGDTTSVTIAFSAPDIASSSFVSLASIGAADAEIPSGVASIFVEITAPTIPDFTDIVDIFNIAPGETVTRTYEIDSGDGVNFHVAAYNGLGATGTILYDGNTTANLTGDAVTVTIDMVALDTPPVSSASPPGGTYASAQSVTLSAVDDNDPPPTIYYTTDGTTPDTSSPVYSSPITISSDTTLQFFSVDNVGTAEGVQSEVYVIDTAAPDTTIDSNPSDPDDSDSGSFTFSSPDGGVSFECQIDGGGFADCTSPENYTGLSDGSHTFEVVATDAAGNIDPSPASYTWEVDTGLPDTIASPSGGPYAFSQSVTLTCDDGPGSGCAETVYCLGTGCTPATSYSGDIDIASSTDLRFSSVDNAGNNEPVKTETYTIGIASDLWTTKASMPTPRHNLTSSVADGKIYVIGGSNGTPSVAQSTVEEYDPATNIWTNCGGTCAPMPTARMALTSSVVNGKIYVIGGNYESLNVVEEYDPVTNTWTNCGGTCAPMPTGRYGHTSSVVNGKIFVIGGIDSTSDNSTVEEYDPATNTWTNCGGACAPVPSGSFLMPSSVLNGKIYLFGGSSGLEYDPVANTWTIKNSMPTARVSMTSSVANGKMYVIGGWDGSTGLSTVEAYDPTTNSWATKASMPTSRAALTSSVVNGKIYTIGGFEDGSTAISTVEAYNPKTIVGTWGFTAIDTNSTWWHSESGTITFNSDNTGTLISTENNNGTQSNANETFTYTTASNPDGSVLLTFTWDLAGDTDTLKLVLSDNGNMAIADITINISDWPGLVALIRLGPSGTYSDADLFGDFNFLEYDYKALGGSEGLFYRALSGTINFDGNANYSNYIETTNGDGTVYTSPSPSSGTYSVSADGLLAMDGSTDENSYVSGDGNLISIANPQIVDEWINGLAIRSDRFYETADMAGTWAFVTFADYLGATFSSSFGIATCDSGGTCTVSKKKQTSDGSTSYGDTDTITFTVASDGTFGSSLSGAPPSYAGAIGNDGNTFIINDSFNPTYINSRMVTIGVRCTDCTSNFVTISDTATGSATPSTATYPEIVTNGNFGIIGYPESDPLVGDGLDEVTMWDFHFTEDPDFADFLTSGTLDSARLTLTLIPKIVPASGTVGGINTDAVKIEGLAGINNPFVPDIFTVDVPATIELDLLDYYDVNDIMSFFTASPNGQINMRYDDDAIISSATLELTKVDYMPNATPTADITAPSDDSEFTVGDLVTFTGFGTDTEEGPLTGGSLVWSSGRDGIIGTGTTMSTNSLSEGAHTITLSAEDSFGAIGNDSVLIWIEQPNLPPVISLSADPISGVAPLSVTLTASASDPDGTIENYEWDFDGDDTYDMSGTDPTISHAYDSVGTFNPQVRVTDNGGDTATASVLIPISVFVADLPGALAVLSAGDILTAKGLFKDISDAFDLSPPTTPEEQNNADTTRFFYAITRVLALWYDMESDGDPSDLNRLGDILDAFGCDSVGRDDPLTYNATCSSPMPDNSPTSDELLNFLNTIVRPELEGAIANFDDVSDTFNIIWIEFIGSTDVESDYGDVLVLRAALKGALALGYDMHVYNLSVDLDEENNDDLAGTNSTEEFFADNPNFLTLINAGLLDTVKSLTEDALDDATAAITWIRAEEVDQGNDWINLGDSTSDELDEALIDIATGKSCLIEQCTVDDNETPSDTTDDLIINLSPFINPGVDIRSLIATYVGNDPTGFLPDSTFAGMLVQLGPFSPTVLDTDTNDDGLADIFDRPTQMTTNTADDTGPDWSPDGSRIAFRSNRSGNYDIWIMDVDGSDPPMQLTYTTEDEGHPHFSPDGLSITFWSERTGNREVWIMDSNGMDPLQVTNNTASDGGAQMSPDGTKIVFRSDRSGNDDIWIVNINTTGAPTGVPTQLTTDPASDGRPHWNPDGLQIVFESTRSGNQDIWFVNIDATGTPTGVTAQVTTDPASDGNARFSPDGSNIVFWSQRWGNQDIWIMGSVCCDEFRLDSINNYASDGGASWSPDGSRIVFRSNRSGNNDIYVLHILLDFYED